MSHYYTVDGDSAHEVEALSGKMRPTNVRDARKLGLKPSVTTVMAMKASPGLQVYFQNQILDAVQRIPPNLPYDEWRKRVILASKQHSKTAAVRGGEIHDALERYYLNGEIDELESHIIEPAIKLLDERFPGVKWIAEQSFCEKFHGYGGRVDLHSKDGDGIIVDFKTKDGGDLTKFKAYADHHMQSAAYAIGLDIFRAERYNLFISRDVPKAIKLTESDNFEKDFGMFKHLLEYWKLVNSYDSGEVKNVK